jgi:hypothetical protein
MRQRNYWVHASTFGLIKLEVGISLGLSATKSTRNCVRVGGRKFPMSNSGQASGGLIIVIFTVLSVFVAALGVFVAAIGERGRARMCDFVGMQWFCGTEIADLGSNPPILPTSIGEPLAIAINGIGIGDAKVAAALNKEFPKALGKLRDEASGYIIRGLVSQSRVTPTGSMEFLLSWKLAKGRVSKQCAPIPVEFKANMPSLAALYVSKAVSPFIQSSVQYGDVRC